MPARQHTPLSGSPLLSDLPRDESQSDARHRDFDSGPVELKPKVAPRSGSFASPLRDSFRESFFDLAQRYHTLRDAARRATGSRKPVPELGAKRERRLTDLPPPPPPAPRARVVSEEPPEEPTLVQPLAARAPEAVPAESERRPTTMRPPPPPEPLPRMMLPSSMPPALALPTNPPPPPAPPPSVWRPMLAAAALSATIGALVSGGFVALRSFSAPRATTASTSTVTPTTMAAGTSTGPCPVGVATSGTGASDSSITHTTSWSQVTSSSGTTGTSSPSSTSHSSSSSSSPAPLQVSVENLPLLGGSSSKLTESRATTPMHAAVHVAPPVRAVAAAPPPQTAAERRRAKKEAAAAAAAAQHAAAKSNDDDDDDSDAPKAEPPPPPAPTKGPDKAVIAKAVARAASAATSCDSGPRNGRALITFAPSGNVQSVSLVESFGDQAVNGCVLRALGRAHVPPFAGGPVEVRKGLSW